MDEVTAILITLGALFAGLLVLSWACGDFQKRPASTKSDSPQPPASA